jgi:ADP-ribose pyrophosphatase
MRTIVPAHGVTIPPQAERVFKGVIFDVYQWQQEMFDGTYETFEMLRRPDTVKVIAVKEDKIIVLEQEQPNMKAFFDIPGGIHDDENESELEAAKRELVEETGMTFRSWKLLSVVQPNRKFDWFMYTFLATDLIETVATKPDAGEKIEILHVTLNEAKEMLSSPKARVFPRDLENVTSIQELESLPEYQI